MKRTPAERYQALLALPDDETSLGPLLQAASDSSLQIARDALTRLARVGTQAEAAALRRRLLTCDLALVRDIAATSRALGDEQRAAETALGGLRDPSPSARMHAALALGELAHPDASAALRAALGDEMAGVRRSAADALGRRPVGREEAAALAERLDDKDAVVRAAAVRALATGADLSPLGRVARDPSPAVRLELARHARRLDDELVRELLRDADPDVRTQTLWMLVAEPRPQLEPELAGALEDPDWRVRRAACRAVAAADRVALAPALVSALVDPHETVRAAAVRAIGELFGPDAVDVLIAALPCAEANLRRALVYAVADADAARALPAVAPCAKDADPDVRIAVARLAGRVHTQPEAEHILHLLAKDTDPGVAHAASTMLAETPE